ncbi:MAG TPA: alanine--tRNA ligase [Gammaproteobacteria bacterium]|nr:alanine--tRNA ligase [Gammaproteobacteria bacterium]
MTTNDIRESFLEFFRNQKHTIVPAASLVPPNDPTLMFTNSGMVQFKDIFLGREKPRHLRVADVQPCLRAGGKHNDLENVGYTARHHTFFEMLGNWSFGDYFKRDAIVWSWELLTKIWKLPAERLWVTVYHTDDEAYDIWTKEVRVPKARVVRIGDNKGAPYASDNFWQMADTGPCGPCTEIFWDHGPGVAGSPPGSKESEGDRYVEIWNLVFMQFDRDADGRLTPLPKPCVDTGMGLERIAAVMQGVHDNYDIDVFQRLIYVLKHDMGLSETRRNLAAPASLKAIADHIRATSFLILDGVLPSNEGRGYVLRRIMRRAIRHGRKLGFNKPFFNVLVGPLAVEMGEAYPRLNEKREYIQSVILKEEEGFAETLTKGLHLLESAVGNAHDGTLSGDAIFKLYDTYGFPVDLTNDIARERGLKLDMAGFEREMEKQRERGRAASQFGAEYAQDVEIEGQTKFTGYETLKDQGKIVALFRGKDAVKVLKAGAQGMVVLDCTPFYAESGGQVGDKGVLRTAHAEFKVDDTQKRGGGAHAHLGTVVKGEFNVGETVEAQVDENLRAATVLNHSATHLLHAALRKVLGTHVIQKGSLVAPDRLRFDFSHNQPVTPEELRQIEDLVNAEIRKNAEADVRQMPYDDAIRFGAMALFGEKYGDTVRVMKFGDFSIELCGGTHVHHVGDIGFFKIISETGVAAGIRRIEALTGEAAVHWAQQAERTLHALADLTKSSSDTVGEKVEQLVERNRRLEKELEQLRGQLASRQGGDLASQAVEINGFKVLASRLDGADAKTLRDTVDQLKNKLGSAAVVLAAVEDGKVRLVAGVTADRTSKIKAGELANHVAEQVGGKGGGRADMAQAGGTDPEKLDAALKSVPEWVRAHL